jgi:MinD-like ATPase involved in chromosome partitioning or flagellar assembly
VYVITFYSFKGGVGRTMALVNIAAEMVRCGRKVLVVDFDLEAPGLETYKQLRPPKPHPGIVEYVTAFRQTGVAPDPLDYIYETKPIGKKGGRLWVMPAGRRDDAYRSALASLDWQRLYEHEDGFLLFEDLKKGWEEELQPECVLIDSRTGDTDVLGICTRQLPDAVVLMFTPNEQNLAGLENVCRDIRREEAQGLKKKIRLDFVAANVPDLDDEKGILRRQLQAFRERLNFRWLSGIIHRYENLNLLDQSIFTLERPRSKLAQSYQRLLKVLRNETPLNRKFIAMSKREEEAQAEIRRNEEKIRRLQDALLEHFHKKEMLGLEISPDDVKLRAEILEQRAAAPPDARVLPGEEDQGPGG